MTIPQHHPRQLQPGVVVLTAEDSKRVRRLVNRLGSVRQAQLALGVGRDILEAARNQGRMLATTRDRILAALTAVGL